MFKRQKENTSKKPKKKTKGFSLFKSKKKNKVKKKKINTATTKHLSEKEVIYSDIKVFRAMPIVFLVSLLLVGSSYGLLIKSNHDYKVEQGRVSFKKGTELPLLQGKSDATLKMGNSIVSKDGKDMAVEIKYDDVARKSMSTFGYKYKLYLLASPDYPSDDISIKYGYFSTDGNGVLQIHSKKGKLKNQAFIVGLWDRSGMVDANNLGINQATEDDVDNSITNQLATGNANSTSTATSDSGDKSKKASEPPVFFLRLNPVSAKQTDVNWNDNERELIDQLFVNKNIKHIRKQLNTLKKQKRQIDTNIKEMQARLKENPNDQTAESELSTLQSQQDSINQSVASAQKNYDRLSQARFGKNVLGKEQTKHKTEISNNVANYGITNSNN